MSLENANDMTQTICCRWAITESQRETDVKLHYFYIGSFLQVFNTIFRDVYFSFRFLAAEDHTVSSLNWREVCSFWRRCCRFAHTRFLRRATDDAKISQRFFYNRQFQCHCSEWPLWFNSNWKLCEVKCLWIQYPRSKHKYLMSSPMKLITAKFCSF